MTKADLYCTALPRCLATGGVQQGVVETQDSLYADGRPQSKDVYTVWGETKSHGEIRDNMTGSQAAALTETRR